MTKTMHFAPVQIFTGEYRHRLQPWVFRTAQQARQWAEAYLSTCKLSCGSGATAVSGPVKLPVTDRAGA
jgi:hypothetical protein